MIGHGGHRSLRDFRVDPEGIDEVVHNPTAKTAVDVICAVVGVTRGGRGCLSPSQGNERDQDEEDDDVRPPRRKHLKTGTPA